ncbi:MAG: type IV secretory system conjugative DNA transfer family protein [Cyclobacteriaceae bacterium]
MYYQRGLLNILFFTMVIVLALLGADYYLLVIHQGGIMDWLVEPIQWLEKLLLPLRISLIILWVLVLRVAHQLPKYRKPGYQPFYVAPKLQGVAFLGALICGLLFTNVESTPIPFEYGYPSLLVTMITLLTCCTFLFPEKNQRGNGFVKRKKVKTKESINLPTKGKGYVNVTEPFRHTMVIAGSGSGKTESVVRPYMHQYIENGFCGILYDYKFPTLTNELNTILINQEKQPRWQKLFKKKSSPMPLYIVDFERADRCHRFNPIRPDQIKSINYAEEMATSIYHNLDHSAIKGANGKFFTQSAINWFTALIWFYKVRHPKQCTLPHIINTILYQDFKHVFSMLLVDPIAGDYIRSILTSLDANADRQLGGQVSSLQNEIVRLNTPALAWILTGNDFDLNINDPENPKLLSVGMSPQIRKSLAPIISCIFTAALQQMNVAGKHPSFLELDEATTMYLDDLDHLGAVARSNKIALNLIAQDTAMLVERYGHQKAQTIIANMNNIFFGRINHPDTARMVSAMIGKEDREIISKNEGKNYKSGGQNIGHGFSIQDRPIIRQEEVQTLKKGEFVGRTTDESQPYFWVRFKRHRFKRLHPIEPFVQFVHKSDGNPIEDTNLILQEHFNTVKKEVETIVTNYPNIYGSQAQSSESA